MLHIILHTLHITELHCNGTKFKTAHVQKQLAKWLHMCMASSLFCDQVTLK